MGKARDPKEMDPKTRKELQRNDSGPIAIGWQWWRVSQIGITPLCGSVPAGADLIAAWLEARQPRVKAPGARSMQEINEEVLASIERGEEYDADTSSILVFQRHEGVCCMRFDTFRAHLKDLSKVASGFTGRMQGERSFATKAVNSLYTDPKQYWVPILRPDGTPIEKHDDEIERAIHPKPGMSALKRFERIDPWRIDWRLKVLTVGGKAIIGRQDLESILTYGGTHGYAGERGGDGGKYEWALEEIAAP